MRIRRRLLRRLGPELAGRYRRRLRRAERAMNTRSTLRLRLRMERELLDISVALQHAQAAGPAGTKKRRPPRRFAALRRPAD